MSKENKTKFNPLTLIKNTALAAIIVFIIFIFSIFLLKYTLSYSTIEKYFYGFTGLKLELINPKTTFDYKFNINTKAQYINIYDKNKNTKFISLQNPEISFKPLGLLFKKANFKKFSAKNITVNIKRNQKGQIDLIQNLKIKDYSLIKNNTLTKLNSDINFIRINFKDEYKIKSEITLNLTNTDIKISKKDKSLYFYQTGTIDTFFNSKKQLWFHIEDNSNKG